MIMVHVRGGEGEGGMPHCVKSFGLRGCTQGSFVGDALVSQVHGRGLMGEGAL